MHTCDRGQLQCLQSVKEARKKSLCWQVCVCACAWERERKREREREREREEKTTYTHTCVNTQTLPFCFLILLSDNHFGSQPVVTVTLRLDCHFATISSKSLKLCSRSVKTASARTTGWTSQTKTFCRRSLVGCTERERLGSVSALYNQFLRQSKKEWRIGSDA